MYSLYTYPVFVLQFLSIFSRIQIFSAAGEFQWNCHLSGERRLECRNLFNFYFSFDSLCAGDSQVFTREKFDELSIQNDYHCFDHSHQCYFQIDPNWTLCFKRLRKLTIANVSFIVRNNLKQRPLPIQYLKVENTHGSLTELLNLFEFTNQSSIYINNKFPRWSGLDLYAVYLKHPLTIPKQMWISVYDWYPMVYMSAYQRAQLQKWLLEISCLYIALGDCRLYQFDMLFLRDLFGMRQEISNELYCYSNRGQQRFHWSRVPELYQNYIVPRKILSNPLVAKQLHEQCFNQFLNAYYTINSFTDLRDFYGRFRRIDSISIPLFNAKSFPNWNGQPTSSTAATTIKSTSSQTNVPYRRPPAYPSRIDYMNILNYANQINETRWMSSVEAYPDGRFILIDNRNQHILLLNENGTFRIDLTSIYMQQIHNFNQHWNISSTFYRAYSFANVHIDDESYTYFIPTLLYYVYVFSPENRLVRCLTPRSLGISIMRSDCFAITQTGLIYVCDDAYRAIRIYSRMGVYQRTIQLEHLPFKLFISKDRIFSYSIENLGKIEIYSLTGAPIRNFTKCSYNLLTEVVWFRDKFFLTCGMYLYVIDESGYAVAEQNFFTLLEQSNSFLTIQDMALNRNGLLLMTLRRNGTLFNRYWAIRPAIV